MLLKKEQMNPESVAALSKVSEILIKSGSERVTFNSSLDKEFLYIEIRLGDMKLEFTQDRDDGETTIQTFKSCEGRWVECDPPDWI